MQVTIGTGDGETFQTEVDDASRLVGKSIGDEFEGGIIGLDGYTLEITGGSDRDGFPMRETVDGSARRKLLL
ncbi:MAG: S6e family ribosomal protein, partial [Candidatus Nanohaloarchaea archaeon]